MSGRAGALAARPTDKEAEKGRVEQARVSRYRAGKAPEWAKDGAQQGLAELQLGDREVVRTEGVAAPVIVKKADPRLARLAATRGEDAEEARARHREIRAAEIVRRHRHPEDDTEDGDQRRHRRAASQSQEPGSGPGADDERTEPGTDTGDEEQPDVQRLRHRQPIKEEEVEEDEEEALKRRQAVRERLLQQQREAEAAAQQAKAEEEEEEEEESSEYETDSEEEGYGRRLLKPVFVPKESRDTVAERERLEREEEEALEREKQRALERKAETRKIVAETLAADAEAARAAAAEKNDEGVVAHESDIDTDDEGDQVEEFEAWKQRELARIRRAKELAERQEREALEREKLKNMTDEERAAYFKANPKEAKQGDKKKWKFMQKYWHKGAYFQEDADDIRGTTQKDEIFDRDYSAPTGEDAWLNKELLPKVMQVKNFGRSGRTKWTHLLAEDTTNFDDPLAKQYTQDKRRIGAIMGSSNDGFSKPKKFKT